MFGLGFLLIAALFVFVVIQISRSFPSRRWRVGFLSSIFGTVLISPFLYRLTPSYAKFNELCAQHDNRTYLKTRKVDFVYLEPGYASDCSPGLKKIGDLNFSGFDCLTKGQAGTALYRFTKKSNWRSGCGLECFDSTRIAKAEAHYEFEQRYGYFKGDRREITCCGPNRSEIPSSEKLTFSDWVFTDAVEGELGYTTRYFYHPYGTGWARILGMASGSAPYKECKPTGLGIDAKDVYKPKRD